MINVANKIRFFFLFTTILYFVSMPLSYANITVISAPPGNINVNTSITYSGNLSCAGLVLKPGDGSPNIFATIAAGTFTVSYTYANSGTFVAELAEFGVCAPTTTIQLLFFTQVVSNPTPPVVTPPIVTDTLAIKSIDVTFQNNRKHITVDNNDHNIKAQARINYTGSGLIDGYWEIDGHMHLPIKKYLLSGNNLQLETPDLPLIPTYKEGLHNIRLFITSPSIAASPSIAYIVRNVEKIKLINPSNYSQIQYEELVFTWSGLRIADSYTLSIFDEQQKNVYQAITNRSLYEIPNAISKEYLKSGSQYHWAIEAKDINKNIISNSEQNSFAITKSETNTQRQILFLIEPEIKLTEINNLLVKHSITVAETHKLHSINKMLILANTKSDIIPLIKSLQKDTVFEQPQPNYIFRTDATSDNIPQREPMDKFNKLVTLLHLEKQTYTGKNTVVGVIDSGIDRYHEDLKESVIKTYNYLPKLPEKAETHGTAVAGIIASRVNNKGSRGIAPDTKIIGYRACYQADSKNSSATCTSKSLALSLDQAILDKVSVVNMSLGSEEDDQIVSLLIDEGHKQKIIFTAPAGNTRLQSYVSFPARHPAVVSVAGVTETGAVLINNDLLKQTKSLAPAENLFTTIPDNKYNFMNGSSMSTAIITGLLLLAHEKFGEIYLDKLPKKNLDICIWQSELLKTNSCN